MIYFSVRKEGAGFVIRHSTFVQMSSGTGLDALCDVMKMCETDYKLTGPANRTMFISKSIEKEKIEEICTLANLRGLHLTKEDFEDA